MEQLWREAEAFKINRIQVDRCNSLLAGAPACLLNGLHTVVNATMRLICNRRKHDHVTLLLCDVLHWLPFLPHIEFKLRLLVFQITAWGDRKSVV